MSAILSLQAPLSAGPFLKISNNLSDVADIATSRTNLGLVAGGAGDIWVEKAGDTMGGSLVVQGTLTIASDLDHEGDADTKIGFITNKVTIDAGGLEMAAFIEAATDEVVINDNQVDINFRVEGNAEENLILADAGTDTVIVAGTTADQLLASVFTVVNKTTDHTTPKLASYVNFAPNLSSASAQTYRAMQFEAQLNGSGGNTLGIIGVIGEARYNQTFGTLADLTAASSAVRVINAGDVTAGFGYRIVPILTSTGDLVTYQGFEARSPIITSSGTITTATAVYIHQQNVTGVTTGYGIYQVSTADINYFAGDVGLGTATPQGRLHIGDPANTNYAKWAADGFATLVGTARASEDIQFNVVALKLGASAPTTAIIGVTPILLFDATTDEEVHGSMEIPHNYDDGSDFRAHFHWAPTDGTAGNVTWGIEYHITRDENNETLTEATTTSIIVDATQSLQDEVLVSGNITISGIGVQSGDHIHFRVFRDADASEGGASDTYANNATLISFDVEYQIDGFGADNQF